MFELNTLNVLVLVAWVTVLLWALGAVLTVRGLRRQKPLEASADGALMSPEAPLVSVLVPARDEEGRVLPACLRSILSQDYGRFEVIAVNDRSTDATGPILHAIAKADQRLRVIDGVELPPEWLGKPHAMQQALQVSEGEWILATDADMIFEREVLRTAMAHALSNNYDAVTLVPHVVSLTFWERVGMPVFGWFMALAAPIPRINNPARSEALGVGGFFLVRREWLRRVGAYQTLRADVAEDVRLAELLKQSGARLRIEYAPTLVSTRMYPTFRELWEGFTKNLFAGAKFNLRWTIIAGFGILLSAVAPVLVALSCAIALLAGAPIEWLRLLVPALLVWVIQVVTFSIVNRTFKTPLAYALTVPLGHALFVAVLFNSAFKISFGRGVTWKGRKIYEREGVRPPRAGSSPPDLDTTDD